MDSLWVARWMDDDGFFDFVLFNNEETAKQCLDEMKKLMCKPEHSGCFAMYDVCQYEIHGSEWRGLEAYWRSNQIRNKMNEANMRLVTTNP